MWCVDDWVRHRTTAHGTAQHAESRLGSKRLQQGVLGGEFASYMGSGAWTTQCAHTCTEHGTAQHTSSARSAFSKI